MKLDLHIVGLYPREISTYCATEISNLMNALRGMYGLRRICLSVTDIVLSAATVHLLNLPSQSAAIHLTQALQDLQTMSVNHRYAVSCIEIINRLADQWGIALPEAAKGITPFRSPDPPQAAAPNMSVYFTQAALSNESIDALSITSGGRHDSGSLYEPSFVQHSYAVLPQQTSDLTSGPHNMQSFGSTPHGLQSTPVHNSAAPGGDGLWQHFQTQQMVPTEMHGADYPMMPDQSAYGFHSYGPPGR